MITHVHRCQERDTIELSIADVDDCASDTLEAMYFSPRDGRWGKSFRTADLLFDPDLEVLDRNFRLQALSELLPDPPPIEAIDSGLEWIADEFSSQGVHWWLAGSGALHVRGLDIRPHDLDIMADLSDADTVARIVAPLVAEPFHRVSGWVVKGFGVAFHHCRIDVAFDPESWVDGEGPVDFGPYAASHLESIEWHGRTILVPPLELHLPANEKRGRNRTVGLIRTALHE